MVATGPCSVDGCDRPGRNGKARLGKYCDVHIPEGILAGSVTSHKRQATSPAPSSSSTQVSSGLPESWKLLDIVKIFGSRCAPACCLMPACLLLSTEGKVGSWGFNNRWAGIGRGQRLAASKSSKTVVKSSFHTSKMRFSKEKHAEKESRGT